MCHIKRGKCSVSAFVRTADNSDYDHENDFIDENSQDNKLDNDLFHSNTSLPIVTEDSDAFFEMN